MIKAEKSKKKSVIYYQTKPDAVSCTQTDGCKIHCNGFFTQYDTRCDEVEEQMLTVQFKKVY